MCMSKGAPKKPEYGPCRESHNNLHNAMADMVMLLLPMTIFGSMIEKIALAAKEAP